MRIWIGQIAPRVGDIDGNLRLMQEQLALAQKEGCQLAVFPELAITGYPPEDLLFLDDFITASEQATQILVQATRKGATAIVFGAPRRGEKGLYNSAFVAVKGKIVAVYDKQALPNYGVFDEMRYFTPGDGANALVKLEGLRIGVGICEDLWRDEIAEHQAQMQADLWLNLNASPFHVGKQAEREALVAKRARQFGAPVVYLNPVGGQDELVFDGGSHAMTPDGRLLFRFPLFQVHSMAVDLRHGGEIAPLPDADVQMLEAIVCGVRDYVQRNGAKGAIIGLSGGIDSSLTAAIAVEALGPEAVLGVLMPSPFTSSASIEDAEQLARNLGIAAITVPIGDAFAEVRSSLAPVFRAWGVDRFDVAEENMQARLRGLILMAISNKTGKIVLSTGNKSEMAVGYATLYGDMVGGFAVLKDVYKTEVYRLARLINVRAGKEIIPQRVFDKPPSAELRPNQKDEDALPPYAVLDAILRLAIEEQRDLPSIIAAGYDAATVRRVLAMLHAAEYKRRQAPPGVKLSMRAFGRDRRFPITHHFHPWRRR